MWPGGPSSSDIQAWLKHNGRKDPITINKEWPGAFILKFISSQTRIPIDEAKVVIKGRIATSDTIADRICENILIMVIGVPCEDSEGIDERDISCLMSQMNITRNQAVKSLRKSNSLLDAMMDVGNNQ